MVWKQNLCGMENKNSKAKSSRTCRAGMFLTEAGILNIKMRKGLKAGAEVTRAEVHQEELESGIIS